LTDFIDLPGQSRWYKFNVQPGSKLVISLTGLAANYDLTLYKDIAQAFKTLNSPADLLRLDAEFAPEAFSPEAFSPEAFSPEAFSPEAFSPEAFSPEAFSPEAFSPEAFSPEAFSPEAFSPEAFSADAYSPEAFSPEAFSPEAFSPEAFSPEAFSPEAFSSAQSRSLIGISAFEGVVSEGLQVNTWDSTGDFYVRVRGRNGAFDVEMPFNLSVRQIPGSCTTVSDVLPASTLVPDAGGYHTLILTNLPRMEGSPEEKSLLLNRLQQFALRPEVAGKIIDLSLDDRFTAAEIQARQNLTCPYAMNLAASTIKETVDAFWELNPALEYLVIIGNDEVIPFFRHADHAMLGNEKSFVPPVRDNTSSQTSLRLGYVLSQDDYGASLTISLKDDAFPVPDLGVGRLVETAAEATGMLDAYLITSAGVVGTPASAFVSGYDFLDDAARAVRDQLSAGMSLDGSVQVNTLISPRQLSPTDPSAWTADQLRAVLLTERHDLIFLAGHFSASSALAADYSTRFFSTELISSEVNLLNSLVFSVGCHSGYNIVNSHNVPGVTREPDWAQAFARKQATLIAGTGYQYGDTDFIRYSEKLYLEFARQLRVGTGPVSIGQALVRAKQAYLASTPYLRGIDEKAVLQATIFGLPMLSYNLPGRLLDSGSEPSIVSGTQVVTGNPGQTLGLETYDLNVQPQLAINTVELTDVQNLGVTNQAVYLSGSHEVISKPNEPVLPLAQYNVSVPGKALRGIGFRAGSYADMLNILPFTGAPSTEIRGVHSPFQSNFFYPVQLWRPNYFSALDGGNTLLNVFPAQYISSSPTSITGTLRRFDQLDLRLFYSSNIESYTIGGFVSTPALAAAPSIINVMSQIENGLVRLQSRVIGDPAAGIQQVWVTFTGLSAPFYGSWQSLDLVQNSYDSSLWEAELPLNNFPAGDIRFVVQAVSGVGLVSMDTNQGSYYIPGVDPEAGEASSLALVPNAGDNQIASSGRYTEQVTFSARLTSNGAPLAGKAVAFILGPQSRLGITDSNGVAVVTLSIYGLAGDTEVRTSFAGDGSYQASFAAQPFTIQRQISLITVDPQPASGYGEEAGLLTARLLDVSGRSLSEETVFFALRSGTIQYYEAVITDYAGRASLGSLPLPPGSYQVSVYFSGQIPLTETINLTDDRYEPAVYLDGSLTLLNHLPLANIDSYPVEEDGLLAIAAPGVLGNDSDQDGAQLTALLASGPNHGTLNLNPDGSFSYAPDLNYNGSDDFSYYANDGQDNSLVQVSIQVTAVNDAPQAYPDTYAALEDTDLTIPAPGLLGNDQDVDGDALSAFLVSLPSAGTVTLNQNGSFTYHPEQNYNGRVSFLYQANDGQTSSEPALVTIEVGAVNDPPSCITALPNPDSLWSPNGLLIPVSLINISDPEGNPFNITISSVFQDEPVGREADAFLQGPSALLRSERDGNGNGRVYHIYFSAVDLFGASCTGHTTIGVVPHDQSGNVAAIDGGPLYDSTLPQ
ncbi:MAG TPA: tandem-95 repeat protein, partial [Anaerolineales bacterium]|nr:tandem-95 repeat protein [Anaerolineales bacterium]